MTQEEKTKLAMQYQDNLLDIIDNIDEFDRSDLQGAIMAQCLKLIYEVEKYDNTQ